MATTVRDLPHSARAAIMVRQEVPESMVQVPEPPREAVVIHAHAQVHHEAVVIVLRHHQEVRGAMEEALVVVLEVTEEAQVAVLEATEEVLVVATEALVVGVLLVDVHQVAEVGAEDNSIDK